MPVRKMTGSGLCVWAHIERQRDVKSGEWKYLVRGHALDEDTIVVVAKLSLTGKLVFITVYRWRGEEVL